MASLADLKSQLSYWNNQLVHLNDELKKYKKRRSDVEAVIKALKSVSRSNADDVNARIKLSASQLDSAINHSTKDGSINSIFAEKNDAGSGDGDVSSSGSELQSELNEIAKKIAQIEKDINNAKVRIADLKAAIMVEEQRIAQEKITSFFDGLFGKGKNGGFR